MGRGRQISWKCPLYGKQLGKHFGNSRGAFADGDWDPEIFVVLALVGVARSWLAQGTGA